MRSMLELSEVPASSLEAIAPEWRELWDRCPEATPFQHPAWLMPWWRHLWGGGRPWWIALRSGGRLVGLAPMFVWGRDARCVSLAGSGITDYLDFLIESAHAGEGAAMVLDHLAHHRGEWDLCDFQELRPRSPLLDGAAAGLRASTEPCSVCPVLRLPATWDAMQAALPAKFRTDMRRARNRVRNAGGEVMWAEPQDIGPMLCALFRLHATRWQERGDAGVLATVALQSFHRDAARALAGAGMLRLSALRIGGDFAAVFYGFATHGRFYAYLDGFDPALARLSPGSVLLSCAVERAIAEGLAEFDFLRKGEQFKYAWGGEDRVNLRLSLEP